MTENRAKNLLCQMYLLQFDKEEKEALTMAIQTLEEIQEYKKIGKFDDVQEIFSLCKTLQDVVKKYSEIGTTEEFKALKEKNTPKEPLFIKRSITQFYACPHCSSLTHYTQIFSKMRYCEECGGALKWKEGE